MLHFDFVRPVERQHNFRNLSKKSFFKFEGPQISYNLSYCRDNSCTFTSNLFLLAEKNLKLLEAILLAAGLVKVLVKRPSGRPFSNRLFEQASNPGKVMSA